MTMECMLQEQSQVQQAIKPKSPLGQSLSICMLATKFYATSDMGGGLERSARRLMLSLGQAGHRLVVLTRNYDGLPRREEIDGAQVERLPVWGRSRWLVSLSYLLQALGWLICHRREYQLIHCHQSYAPALVAGLAKLLLGKPVVVKISTSDAFSERQQLRRLPLFKLRLALLRRVDRFVVVNQMAAQEFVDMGVSASRIISIPNGVSISEKASFDIEAKQSARKRLNFMWPQLVVFTGRLSAEKNLSVLVDAWPKILQDHPDAHLVLVGDGGTFRNVEPQLCRQVQAMGLQAHVLFAGRVADVQDYLLAADVFVLPSSTEGMSNALLEAMAAGCAIVASRVPGNAALIQNGYEGLLVEPGNVPELASAIHQLLGFPEHATQLAKGAREAAQERFAIHKVSSEYIRLYTTLVSANESSI